MDKFYHSWGNHPDSHPKFIHYLNWRTEAFPIINTELNYLPFGNGRSYGDSCLNNEGILIDTQYLNKFIAFDTDTGILQCESGVLLADILQLIVPQGWFLPVTPGTKFVTLGGAIANDVHGKNHHIAGSFGCHVKQFELLRSDNTRLLCSPANNAEWFSATIGGLGLTGIVTWAEIQLIKINNPYFVTYTKTFSTLDDYFAINAATETNYRYTMAWIDCLHAKRGVFMAGNHASYNPLLNIKSRKQHSIIYLPIMHRVTAKLINTAYYLRQSLIKTQQQVHYEPYLYPLDQVHFRQRAFVQHQSVLPIADSTVVLKEMLRIISKSTEVPYIAVLKTFGNIPSLGMLSFPRNGTSLAVDFVWRGASTYKLLQQLNQLVMNANGAIYPAKDAHMSANNFAQFFPQLNKFVQYVDPKFSSDFWRRVGMH